MQIYVSDIATMFKIDVCGCTTIISCKITEVVSNFVSISLHNIIFKPTQLRGNVDDVTEADLETKNFLNQAFLMY